MNHSYILWIATTAYALHIVEEYTFDWKSWAVNVLGLPADWIHFALVNGVVVLLGISCASVGWACPVFSLSFSALMLINATFFHVLPFARAHGRFSPGLITAVILFYPIGLWAYGGAYVDCVLTAPVLVGSMLLGGLLMGFPIALLKFRSHPYFKQGPG